MDPALSADGIDEALRLMYGGTILPGVTSRPTRAGPCGLAPPTPATRGKCRSASFTGTDPADQKSYDQPAFHVAAAGRAWRRRHEQAAATITGTAADLDCWLWNRPSLADRSTGPATMACSPLSMDLIAGGVN